VPRAAATAPSSLVVIGDGLLLLGVVVALAGGIQFYAENRYSRKLARWGGFLSAIGAAIVLLGTAAEVTPASRPKAVELGVLLFAAAVVIGLLVFPHLPRCLRGPIEKRVKKDPDDKDGQGDRAAAQRRREGEGDEVRPEQGHVGGGQLAQAQADAGQPR
jgi:hypothetical protein